MRRPLAILLIAGLAMTACGGKVRQENERLRDRVVELEDRAVALERENAELTAQIAAATMANDVDPDGEWVRAEPQVAAIALDRYSHARDTDGDGVADELVVYVRPRDGRGRFVQLAGALTVHAAVLPADGPARTLGRATLAPLELRDAYRSGFMGTHYVVVVPIERAAPTSGSAHVTITYEHGRTGATIAAAGTVDLEPHERVSIQGAGGEDG